MKFNNSFVILCALLITLAAHISIQHYYHTTSYNTQNSCIIDATLLQPSLSSTLVKEVMPFNGTYQKRNFAHAAPLFSTDQFEAHKTLYHKYVDKRNEIIEQLKKTDMSQSNKTYSLFRSLKIAQTYATNGQILHELYFEQTTPSPTIIAPLTKALIIDNFGSIDAFKKELFCCALSARGWALCAYGLDDGKLHTYVLEEHDSIVPILSIPLIVIDTYEHAYFIDYATNITPYLEKMWAAIDWDVIEKRIETWVKPFLKNQGASL